jgi:hypothetical protein
MKAGSDAGARRTGWLEGVSSPARPGVYERRGGDGRYACWDGSRWRRGARSAAEAARQQAASREQRAPWRGLVEASAAPCSTCRGHTVVDHGIDVETGADLIHECPDC